NSRVLCQNAFQLPGVDVEAGTGEHRLEQPYEPDVAVRVLQAEVPRPQPAIVHGAARPRRLADISLEDILAAHADLTHLSRRHGISIAVVDRDLHARDRRAQGPEAVRPVRCVEQAYGTRLREAVSLT